jgi:glycerate kinase
LGGEWVEFPACDALGRPITGKYALVRDPEGRRTAVIEMADTAGIWRIAPDERNPLVANTYGTGLAVRHAVWESGAEKVILGLGGSATNDGGLGFAQALGWVFQDERGWKLPPEPRHLKAALAHVHPPERLWPEGRAVVLQAACDVANPLLGRNGSTTVYGPQKGVTAETHPLLEEGLALLARLRGGSREGVPLEEIPGSGAAGGMGYGVLAWGQGELIPGFDLVAEVIGLDALIAEADLVITGEGSLDAQSLEGKGPVGVARRARKLGKPVIALAGRVAPEIRAGAGEFDAAAGLCEEPMPLEQAIANAKMLLEEKSALLARLMRLGKTL